MTFTTFLKQNPLVTIILIFFLSFAIAYVIVYGFAYVYFSRKSSELFQVQHVSGSCSMQCADPNDVYACARCKALFPKEYGLPTDTLAGNMDRVLCGQGHNDNCFGKSVNFLLSQ